MAVSFPNLKRSSQKLGFTDVQILNDIDTIISKIPLTYFLINESVLKYFDRHFGLFKMQFNHSIQKNRKDRETLNTQNTTTKKEAHWLAQSVEHELLISGW